MEDIEFTHGDLTIVLAGDCDEIVPWLEPDDRGAVRGPTSENYDEFLAVVVSESDLVKMAEAIEAGLFKPCARYDCARMAWRNSMHIARFQTLAATTKQLTDIIGPLQERAAARAAAALVETASTPNEQEDQPAAPFEG